MRPFVVEDDNGSFFIVIELFSTDERGWFRGFWAKSDKFDTIRRSSMTFVSWDVEQFG